MNTKPSDFCRWECLRSIQRFQTPCRQRRRRLFCAALSRTRTSARRPTSCSPTNSSPSLPARKKPRATASQVCLGILFMYLCSNSTKLLKNACNQVVCFCFNVINNCFKNNNIAAVIKYLVSLRLKPSYTNFY